MTPGRSQKFEETKRIQSNERPQVSQRNEFSTAPLLVSNNEHPFCSYDSINTNEIIRIDR